MKCSHCGKSLLPPQLLGFSPEFKWLHICDVPATANEEKYATSPST